MNKEKENENEKENGIDKEKKSDDVLLLRVKMLRKCDENEDK
jgi:hypothetical protein